MSIRKNFTMPKSVVDDLEELARIMDKKQSQVIQELITERMQKVAKAKKLHSLEKMSGIFSGLIPEDLSIQSIKAQSAN
ncbi:MAG: hypothetical protein JXQ76_02965 [Campylobacterales bacterium]|nr:hypothetical protein [Campylobacterales bacterium]